MSDSLTTGSERLAEYLFLEEGIGTVEDIPAYGVLISSDPGVKAKHDFVMHFAERGCCCEQMEHLLRDLAGPDAPPFKCYSCLARIVLRKWEHGDG